MTRTNSASVQPQTMKKQVEGVTRALRDEKLSPEQLSEISAALRAAREKRRRPDYSQNNFTKAVVILAAAAAAALGSAALLPNSILALMLSAVGGGAIGGVSNRLATKPNERN